MMKTTLLNFDDLLSSVSGVALTAMPYEYITFSSVVTDSRNVVPDSLFVPLIGETKDGHAYIPQAIENGSSVIFITENEYQKKSALYRAYIHTAPVSFVIVQNTLAALQHAAAMYVRKFPKLIRIGITGSSGKTTTKEIVASILAQKYRIVCNQGNLNSETGLPLSVFKIRSDSEIGVFEMGMNRSNEIGELADVLRPQYAIITNIGTAHVGKLGSRQNIAAEKKKIFSWIADDGIAFIPARDDFADFLAQGIKGHIVRFDPDDEQHGIVLIADNGIEGTELSVDGVSVTLHLPGRYNYINAFIAIVLARCFGVTAAQIKQGIEKLVPLPGRSQVLHIKLAAKTDGENERNVILLQDCYNANPESVTKTLEFCENVTGRKIYVLGDMLELGTESKTYHSKIGFLAADAIKKTGGTLIFVGHEMAIAAEQARQAGVTSVMYFSSYDDDAMRTVATRLFEITENNDFIVLKGSRGIGLERIIEILKADHRG